MLSILRTIWYVFLHSFQKRITVQYPEEKPYLAPRYRGRIVLSRDPDGGERCVACNLCAVACPVDCIALQATEDENGRRYPEFFRINFSRCIFCGLCEEACPTYAIQLTPDFEMGEFHRKNLVYEKEDLLIDGPGKYPDSLLSKTASNRLFWATKALRFECGLVETRRRSPWPSRSCPKRGADR